MLIMVWGGDDPLKVKEDPSILKGLSMFDPSMGHVCYKRDSLWSFDVLFTKILPHSSSNPGLYTLLSDI